MCSIFKWNLFRHNYTFEKKMVFCVYAENDLRFSFLENNCIDSTYYSDVGQIVPNIRFD